MKVYTSILYSLLFPTPQSSAPGLFVFLPTVPDAVTGLSPSATKRFCDFFIVSMASRSIRPMSSAHVGIS